jgi:signal transduction histidine kinase
MDRRDQPSGVRVGSRPGLGVLRPAIGLLAGSTLVVAGMEVALLVDTGFEPLWIVLLFPLLGAIYVGAGSFAWVRRPSNRIGPLIVFGGVVCFASGLANTDLPALVATGLVVETLILAVAVHLLHAFPSGRLRDRASRVTVAAGYFVTLVLQAPHYLFDQGGSGPTTVLQIANRHDLGRAGYWLQVATGVTVVVATAVILGRRLRQAEPSRRQILFPLWSYGIFAVLFVPVSATVVRLWFPADGLGLAVAQVAVLAGVPLAFLAGTLRGGFARTGEIEELGAWLADDEGRPALESALRDALGDPGLKLFFWVDDPPGYVNRDGLAATSPDSGRARESAEVTIAGRPVGLVSYDPSIVADRQLVADAARVVALALDHERLTAQLLASREGLRLSRARLVKASDSERRRIARDLHDGLQTRLVLLSLLAGQERDRTPTQLRSGLDEAIVELRDLVQGVIPATLTQGGLYAAAEELADRMPIPVDLEFGRQDGRMPPAVETAGYFVVSEALSNLVKHARADEAWLSIGRREGRLCIDIVDDGVGGARVDGAGLSGLADRVEALEGRLTVTSPTGGGTRIAAELPCES